MCRIDGYAGATLGTTNMDIGIGTRVTRSIYYDYDYYYHPTRHLEHIFSIVTLSLLPNTYRYYIFHPGSENSCGKA